MAGTCSTARELVYEDVTTLDLRRGPAMSEQQVQRALQRLFKRCRALQHLHLPASISVDKMAVQVVQHWQQLKTFQAGSYHGHVDSLRIVNEPFQLHAAMIAPWWQQLGRLTINYMQLGASHAQKLASANLGSVHCLDLANNTLGDGGVAQLMLAP